MLHDNSIKSLKETEKFKRRKQIIDAYLALPDGVSDREVAEHLGFSDMNQVRPRITEMLTDQTLRETGKKKDNITGKTVRVCCLFWKTPQKKFGLFNM